MRRERVLLFLSATGAFAVLLSAVAIGLPRLLRFLEESRLIENLRSGDLPAKQQAAERLGKMQSVRAVPALVDLIRQDESSLCLAALKEIGIKAVPELLPALKDRDPNVRKYIALALGDMQASPAATHLAENLLTDQAEQARVGAVVALRNLGPLAAPVIPALIKALTDVSPEIRYRAAHALWRIGTPARCAEAALRVAFSQDPDVRGRVHAGMALVAVGVGDAQLLGEIQQVVAAEKGRVFKNAADWVQAEAAAIEQELLRKVENNRQ